MRSLLGLLVAALLLGAPLGAQDARTVRVRVTSTAARSVYLDAGRSAGIVPGLEVELIPPNGAPFRATIREVSASSARAEIPPGRPLVPVGTVGEVTVPAREREGEEPRRANDAPEHPPWTFQDYPSGQTKDPLLAPAFGGGPASRPTTWDGRVFGQFLYARDDTDGGGFESYRARLGTRLDVRNLVGLGGRLGFDGEVSRRGLDLFDNGDDTEDRSRIDRLSYAWGDDDLEPWRYEIGRFTSPNVPEVGMIDGAEVLRRLSSDVAVGAGAGFYPLHLPDRDSGDDYGFHTFLQWRPTDDPTIGGTVGFQKTWHEGTPDRDLLFGRFDWSPSDDLRFDASALVDFYTGKDDLKSGTAELTQAFLSASWYATDDLGLGLTGSTYRWAQLLREDLAFAPPELVRNGHVERLSPRAWLDVSDDLRLNARADIWRDQARDGTGGEVGFDWRGAFGSGFDLGASMFYSEGSYLSGPGVRARLSRTFDWGWTGLRYEWTEWSADALAAGSEDFTQHRLGLDVDLALGRGWSALFNGEYITGDRQDAFTLGVFVQRRF